MKLVVHLAVVVVLLQALADHKAVAVGVDGDIAGIEQLVDVGAQQDAVGDVIGVGVGPGQDVRGLQQGRECSPVTAHWRWYASVTATLNAP